MAFLPISLCPEVAELFIGPKKIWEQNATDHLTVTLVKVIRIL